MPWETLTTDDVLALFNDSETDAYNTAKGDAKGNGLAQAVTFVVEELREAISGRDITLGPDGTIPSGFKLKAIGAVRWQFLLALPAGKSLQTDERKKENDNFEELIKGIRDGSIKVSSAVGLPAMALPQIKKPHRRFTTGDQEGL